MTTWLFHLALADEWATALAAGHYDRSTVGVSLAEEGYIHASFAEQVPATAARFYANRTDVVLLRIDPDRLDVEVRVEDLHGTGEAFPHLYGPLPVDAVVSADPVAYRDGRHHLDDLLP